MKLSQPAVLCAIKVGLFKCKIYLKNSIFNNDPLVQIEEPTPLEAQSKSRFTIVRQLANTPYPAGFNEAAAREKKLGFPIQVERTENALLNCLIGK